MLLKREQLLRTLDSKDQDNGLSGWMRVQLWG